jgi:hypothetical protein
MEQTKKSTFKLLFYLKKNELKKNGNARLWHVLPLTEPLKLSEQS